MPRTAIPVVTSPATPGGLADIVMTAADQPNGMEVPNDGKTRILIANVAGAARVITFVSVADPITGRTGDVPCSTNGNPKYSLFGPFPPHLFNQSNGKINVNFDVGTSVTVAAISG